MKNKKKLTIIFWNIIIIVSLFGFSFTLYILSQNYNRLSRFHHHKEAQISEQSSGYDFSTHLPLVIIDTKGKKPKADSKWSKEKGYYVPISGDPYVNGDISIIDNEDGVNSIIDTPNFTSDIKIRLRGNSSLNYDKKQYLIKLVDKNGNKKEQDILGMGKEWEWILNISFIDKSLIRNYIGLNIAGEIMEYTPDVRYCEVFMKNGEEYDYLGVYLMMESVKRDKERINISKYDPHFQKASYILRRDRFDENGLMLNNYGTINNLTREHLEIKYPYKDEIRSDTIDYIEEYINGFEKSIFSDDPDEFYEYIEYIDQKSFIDYFIINEFFANYDAGTHSTYMYKENGEKLNIGPVWDFDGGIDNYYKKSLNKHATAIQSAPWYAEILKDGDLVLKIIKRYKSLRKGILSNQNILEYIDDTVKFIGPAQERDWERWEYFYTSDYLYDTIDGEGNVITRDTETYEEEIEKIKEVLTEHGNWLDENIDYLYQFSKFTSKDTTKGLMQRLNEAILGKNGDMQFGGLLAVLFLIVFVISIILIQRD